MINLSGHEWDDILDSLKVGKCILFIGAGAYQSPGGGDVEEALIKWLDAKNPENPHIKLYSSDGFFLINKSKSRFRRLVISRIKEFYAQSFPETEADFRRLSHMPFTMIFSLTPDNLMARTFDSQGLDYQYDFFFYDRKAPDNFQNPIPQRPLLYNLLGNIEEPDSMVITHSNFFDYLESVFKGASIHDQLRNELESAERFIFLGLPFDKWYFQLLLRVLSMHSEKLGGIERMALSSFEDPQIHKLYTEEFKIEFIPSGISVFIQELHKRCENAGILKNIPKSDQYEDIRGDISFKEIKEMVAAGKTSRAMRCIRGYIFHNVKGHSPLSNELFVLQNRYNLLRQREALGTIYPSDMDVEDQQINMELLEIIDRAKSHDPGK